MRHVGRTTWVFIALSAAGFSQPAKPASQIVRQGEVIKVHGDSTTATARMNGVTIKLFPETDGTSFGLMPVSVLAKPGAYELELLDKAAAVVRADHVTVRDAHYPRQNVVLSKSVAELKSTPDERSTVNGFLKEVSDTRYWTEPFEAPLPGCLTSLFGVQRYVNGKPTGDFHGGIDQRGAAGTPIHAVADGVVRIVHQFNLHGGTVAIDHGQGLESMYLHMSKFASTEGQTVHKGDVIGYVGSTGRSTAPHLHWSLYVDGQPVSPLQWVSNLKPCAPTSVPKRKPAAKKN